MSFKQNLTRMALFAVLAMWGWQANAVMIDTDLTSPVSIPGLSTFATTGGLMEGMRVSATFEGRSEETVFWAATGADSGGVAGAAGDWNLTQSGDTYPGSPTTFNNPWIFTNSTGLALLDLVLDGAPGLTVFDRHFGGIEGTPDSEFGNDFATSIPNDDFITATYSRVVAIKTTRRVGDIFHLLSVDFGPTGVDTSFQFIQDTDSDITISVPEPSILALLGIGLAGMGFSRKRKAAA